MESTQSLDPETPTQSVRGMCPDTCVGCAPRGMCPPGSRPCPTIFVLWYSKLSKVVKSFTMVTTAVGNFSPYSRTKRIPRASSPDPQCERPWLLRGHQLSRSLAIATGRRSEKTNFSPPIRVSRPNTLPYDARLFPHLTTRTLDLPTRTMHLPPVQALRCPRTSPRAPCTHLSSRVHPADDCSDCCCCCSCTVCCARGAVVVVMYALNAVHARSDRTQ